MIRDDEIKVAEENRKIRFLRMLVDLNLTVIMSGDATLEEAHRIVSRLKVISESLFPGKGYVFDLVYLPRFVRAIRGVFNGSIQ